MISYDEMVAEILANLDMNNDSEAQTTFNVQDNLNRAQEDVLLAVPISEVDNVVSARLGNLSANISCYQWPGDFVRRYKLFVDYDNEISLTNPGIEAIFNKKGVLSIYNLDKQGRSDHPFYSFVDGGFELSPIPEADQTNGFLMRYIYQQPKLSSSQDSLLKANMRGLIVARATAKCARVNKYDLELAASWDNHYNEMIKLLWSNNKDGLP